MPVIRLGGTTFDKLATVAEFVATFETLLVVAMAVAVASDTWSVVWLARAVSVVDTLPFKELAC